MMYLEEKVRIANLASIPGQHEGRIPNRLPLGRVKIFPIGWIPFSPVIQKDIAVMKRGF
jgi:hypothetical protein